MGEFVAEFVEDRKAKKMLQWLQDRLAGLPDPAKKSGQVHLADDEGKVAELDPSTFDEFIASHPHGVLVNFCVQDYSSFVSFLVFVYTICFAFQDPASPACEQVYSEFALLFEDLSRAQIHQTLAKVRIVDLNKWKFESISY